MGRQSLPTKLAAFQNQCFDSDGSYVGFQCPTGKRNCPIARNTQGMEIREALSKFGHIMEMAHRDDARFSATHTTLEDQVVIMCESCHNSSHTNESCSRGRRR